MMIDLTDLYVKGWARFEEPLLEQRSDIVEYLGQKYLCMFPQYELIEFTENFKVEESDRIVEWHNDSKFGMNITFLYYANTMQPETGGSISLRNTATGDSEKIYPTAGTLIVMSQKPHVEHQAEFCSIRRHMFNIDFDVKGF